MKFIAIFITALLVCFPSFSMNTKTQKTELMLGKWHCENDVNVMGINLEISIQNNFSKDKSAIGHGTVNVTNPELGMDLVYDVKVAHSWFIQNNMLYLTIIASTINSLKSSIFESLFDINSLLPSGQQDAIKIMTLTQSKFTGLYNGLELNCNRQN